MIKLRKLFFLFLFYAFARKLPSSGFPFVGPYCRWFRWICCRYVFKKCGVGVNIERNAYFGTGFDLEIGDYSGLGVRCSVPSNAKIGSYVMMAPDVLVLKNNHAYESLSTPMALQGVKHATPLVIEDDVWIGQRVIVNPGRRIAKGTILASGTVLVRDFPPLSIVGGNPSFLIRSRASS